MQNIDVTASEIWDYCLNHQEALSRNQHLMAENPDYGMESLANDDKWLSGAYCGM